MTGKIDAVINKIISEISNGNYPPGSRIPSHNQLAAKYACSRSSIDRALTELLRRGKLRGVRGSGTFVAPENTTQESALQQLYFSSYLPSVNLNMAIRQRFQLPGDIGVPYEAIFEEDIPLHLGRISRPGSALIWDCPAMDSLYAMRQLANHGTPQLLINRTFRDYDHVATDQYATMRDALSFLMIEGGRDLTLVSYKASPERPYLYERQTAFFEVAAELGGRFSSTSVFCHEFADPARDIAELSKRLFGGNTTTKAVAILHFDLALPLVTCGRTYGKVPGRDYTLMCFDYVPALVGYHGVCMVRQQMKLMQSEALRWVNDHRAGVRRPCRKLFKAEIITA